MHICTDWEEKWAAFIDFSGCQIPPGHKKLHLYMARPKASLIGGRGSSPVGPTQGKAPRLPGAVACGQRPSPTLRHHFRLARCICGCLEGNTREGGDKGGF